MYSMHTYCTCMSIKTIKSIVFSACEVLPVWLSFQNISASNPRYPVSTIPCVRGLAGPRARGRAAPGGDFFSANEDCISANHMARILIWRRISLTSRKHLQYVYAHVHVRTMYLKYAPYDWLKYRGMAILVCINKNRRPGTYKMCFHPIITIRSIDRSIDQSITYIHARSTGTEFSCKCTCREVPVLVQVWLNQIM